MFFKKWVVDSNNKVKNISRRELNYIVLKSLLKDFGYNISDRVFYMRLLVNFNKLSYITKFTFYCVLSRQPRSILRTFRCSRLFFKSVASKGFIIGLRKASF